MCKYIFRERLPHPHDPLFHRSSLSQPHKPCVMQMGCWRSDNMTQTRSFVHKGINSTFLHASEANISKKLIVRTWHSPFVECNASKGLIIVHVSPKLATYNVSARLLQAVSRGTGPWIRLFVQGTKTEPHHCNPTEFATQKHAHHPRFYFMLVRSCCRFCFRSCSYDNRALTARTEFHPCPSVASKLGANPERTPVSRTP